MTEKTGSSSTLESISDPRVPPWEQRYPGRLDYELNALRSAGIEPKVDEDALRLGRLILTFDWPLDAQTILQLKAVYPDSFPNLRPQVFLVSGIDPMPVRHRSPIEGNLCLLGRDTRQWMPSWTLYKLLDEQLENTVYGTGDEDPQGEPAEYWWNALNPFGSSCLIDSACGVGTTEQGTIILGYRALGMVKAENCGVRVPIIQAYVEEVRDQHNRSLYKWNAPLPPQLARSQRKIRVPWVQLDDTLFPTDRIGQQMNDLKTTYSPLRQSVLQPYQSGLSMEIIAIAHPSELGFGQQGLSWVFFQAFGHHSAFRQPRGRRRKKAKGTVNATVLPIYRAGTNDIGARVPAVHLLRQKRFLIVGVGAIGAPLAVELVRNGCGILHLIEYDIVEPGNTVRWSLGTSAWGKQKEAALQEFLASEYPATEVISHRLAVGQVDLNVTQDRSEDDVLSEVIANVDLVIDASASHGVTCDLAQRCCNAAVPFITVSATPSLEGGTVIRHGKDGGCPICLEHAYHSQDIPAPPGRGLEDQLVQPAGCAERTFVGAGYDLQELSLQTVRLAVETLSAVDARDSLVQTLSFVDDNGNRRPPCWRVDNLSKHPDCTCSR